MNREERLRAALRQEVDDVEPTGSWGDVDARRRRLDRRSRLAQVAVVVVLVAGAVGLAVGMVDDGDDEVTVTNPDTGPVVGDRGIWPFVSAADTRYADQAPFDTTDPVATAEAFLGTVLAPASFERGPTHVESGVAEVVVGNDAGRSIIVRLARLEGTEHWTVTGVEVADITIESPAPGGQVPVPLPVSGRASTADGTVHLAVLERNGTFSRPRELVQNTTIAEPGELQPFAAELDLDPAGVADGRVTILAFTTDGEGGPVERVTAVPAVLADGVDHGPPPVLLPAGEPLALDEFVVVRTDHHPEEDQQSVEVWTADGPDLRRTLLEGFGTSEGGVLDLEVSADRRTVLLALSTSACESKVVALAADGTGEQVELGPGDVVALTPEGDHLAVGFHEACGEEAVIERFNLDGGGDPVRIPVSGRLRELVWLDGGSLAYETDRELGWVSMVDDLPRPIRPPAGRTYTAPARAPAGGLLVVERDGERRRLLVVDPVTGEATAEGLSLADGADVDHLWVAADRPESVLWLASGGTLHRASGQVSEVVLTDVTLAAG